MGPGQGLQIWAVEVSEVTKTEASDSDSPEQVGGSTVDFHEVF